MADLAGVFGTAILPIVAVAGAGALLGRYRDVDPAPLNTVTVYVLAPALVFHSLALTDLGGATVLRVTAAVVATVLGTLLASEAVARLRGETEPTRSALVLSATFPNCGNYGIPLCAFAFGAVGRSTAVLFLAVQAVLLYTVGLYVASRGGGNAGLAGVRRVLRVPLVYAVLAALAARALGVVPPADAALMETVGLVGDASIPVMLLILGVQLARTEYGDALGHVATPTALKLGLAPLVGVAAVLLLGFEDPVVARTVVLESATPVAVTPIILVGEFGGAGESGDGVDAVRYVSTAVLVTTVLSIPVLTGVILVLESGLVV